MVKLVLASIFLFATGCQTDQQEQVLVQEDFSMPPQLWSSQQRSIAAGYYYLLGEYIALRGQKGSDKLIQKAYDLEPNAFLGRKVILSRAQVNPPMEVLVSAKRMVLLYPKDEQLRLIYARLLGRVQNWEEAEKQAKFAIHLDASMVSYGVLLELLVRQEKYKQAVKVSQKMVRDFPSDLSGWLVHIRMQMLLKRYKTALSQTRRALKVHADDMQLQLMQAWSLEQTSQSKKSAQLFETLFKKFSGEQLVPTLLALYREIGGLEEALEVLTRLSRKFDGRYPEVDLQRVFVLWELKKFQEASEILDAIIHHKKGDDRFLYLAALGHEKVGEVDQALKLFERIPAGSEFYPHSLYRSALLLRVQKKHRLALQKLDVLNKSTNSHWQSFALTSAIYVELKQLETALEVVNAGVKRFPKNTSLLFQKGVLLEQLGDIDACIETMELVIQEDPVHAPALNYIGYIYAESGENLEEAEQYIRRALLIRPLDGYYLDSLGWVFFQRGQYKEALQMFLTALESAPKEGVIMEHLADTLVELNRLKEAKQWYRKALEGILDERSQERIQEKLDDLG